MKGSKKMSSFTRTIQRSSGRKYQFRGRGSQLGVTNPKAKDMLARETREKKKGNN